MKDTRIQWLCAAMLACGLACPMAWADEDEYRIQNGTFRVEYDAEDGDLELDDFAEMQIRAAKVEQTADSLKLTGISVAPGVTASLQIRLQADSPWIAFLWEFQATGDVSTLTQVPLLEMELDDNNDRWEAPSMKILGLKVSPGSESEQTLLTVADAQNAGYVIGWQTAGAGDFVSRTTREDIFVKVQANLAKTKTATFLLGKFTSNVQDGVSAFPK